MMRSRVKENTMLFVLIFSLTAGFCSAKDNKPPDTKEGGVRVCGDAVLLDFWCGFAVIFILSCGITVLQNQAVCGN